MAVGRKTGGRSKGTPNKTTSDAEQTARRMRRALERVEKIKHTTLAVLDDAASANIFEGPPDQFLCHVYMDPIYPIDTRVRAATSVLPYLKPKLEAITHLIASNADGTGTINKLELARRVAYLLTSNKQLGSMQDVIDVKADQTNTKQTDSHSAEQTVTDQQQQQVSDRDRSEP